jgi:hypothetical protein
MIPTTSPPLVSPSLDQPRVIFLPIGSSFGKNLRAAAWVRMATLSSPAGLAP